MVNEYEETSLRVGYRIGTMEALEELGSSEKISFLLQRISYFCHMVYRIQLGQRIGSSELIGQNKWAAVGMCHHVTPAG